MSETPEEKLAKCKEEHAKASNGPGIHFNSPQTPFELVMPGGVQKFPNIYFDMTLLETMKTVTFEWRSTTRKLDLPLLEVVIDQYKPGCLNYSLDDYEIRSYAIPDPYFKFTIGKRHMLKFFYNIENSILQIFIDGVHGLFESLEKFEAGLLHDIVRITGDVHIDAIHVPCDTPLPLPLTVQLGNQQKMLCDIKGKKRENCSKQMSLTLGEHQVMLPLDDEVDKEDVTVKLNRCDDGKFTVTMNDAVVDVLPQENVPSKVTIKGDVDVSWVETGASVDGACNEATNLDKDH
ncbi:uncharacterized protein LOC135386978 [Ornithodoros turicata]|uniref:uncharacterized protein LOC135386978 n=1 Tax=Ornithodoros turicata TaxID=34597 RepID=UPI003138D153